MAEKCTKCGERRDTPCKESECPKREERRSKFEAAYANVTKQYDAVLRRLKDR